MRKRKYVQLDSKFVQHDTLMEELDMFQRSRKDATPDTTPTLCIHNLVGTAKIASSEDALDLQAMSTIIPNSVYNKQKFAAITIRLHRPCCTALLFTSGKMVLTGCKTYIECINCALQVVSMLRQCTRGTFFELHSVHVQNMVGNVILNIDSDKYIDLNEMQQQNSIYCTYQKKMFPGLIFRPVDSPIVLLLFTSGRIVVTGGKSVDDMQKGWRVLYPFVCAYIKQRSSAAPQEAACSHLAT
jgi:transcription initiation factor TFIID TATA-box-binding protein